MTQRNYRWFIIALMWAYMGMSCSDVRPENTTEKLFVAQWGLIGATNAVADMRANLSDEDYGVAKSIVLRAGTALDCAKWVAGVPGAVPVAICPTVTDTSALGYLALVNSLLIEAAAYYAARGE